MSGKEFEFIENAPFFSIIIPTYNSANQIDNCIVSLTDQSFANFEVLIIDGLSTDDTIAKVEACNDKRIRIYSEADDGIYDAMNKGIMQARGKWLIFLGSDDKLFDSNVLFDLYSVAKNTIYKVLYGDILLLGDTGWASKGQIYDGRFNLKKLLSQNIAHQAIFYNKTIFEKYGNYNQQFKVCADYDFNLRVSSRIEFHYINKIIARFSAGGTSTGAEDAEFTRQRVNNLVKYFGLKMFNKEFKHFQRPIWQQAKQDIKNFKLIRGIFLGTLGIYFKLNKLD